MNTKPCTFSWDALVLFCETINGTLFYDTRNKEIGISLGFHIKRILTRVDRQGGKAQLCYNAFVSLLEDNRDHFTVTQNGPFLFIWIETGKKEFLQLSLCVIDVAFVDNRFKQFRGAKAA